MKSDTKNKLIYVVITGVIAVLILATFFLKNRQGSFCFNFVHDTQFGDRIVEKPSNKGFLMGNVSYYVPEISMLQTALERKGFSIDEYEKTGGKVYPAAFFGPSTKSAVIGFQKKYGLAETGEVNNDTIDKLNSMFACATSTKMVASTTVSVVKTEVKQK